MATKRLLPAVVLILGACSGGSGPSDGLASALHEAAAAHDTYFAREGRYPDPLTEDGGLAAASLEEWNGVVYYGAAYGYCIEGDDDDGTTWHLRRDDDDPSEGECPRP